MKVVNTNKIEETISEINSLLRACDANLDNIEEANNELKTDCGTLNLYNGAKVAGSDNIEFVEPYLKRTYQRFSIKGADSAIVYNNVIDQEINELKKATMSMTISLMAMHDSLVIIAIYITNIEYTLSSSFDENQNMDFLTKLTKAAELMQSDYKNGYNLLYNTPILENGKTVLTLYGHDYYYEGEYLKFYNKNGWEVTCPLAKIQVDENNNYIYVEMTDEEKENYLNAVSRYYNDIMHDYESYPPKLKESANKYLNNLQLMYIDYDQEKSDGIAWAAYVNNYGKNCVVDMNYATSSQECYDYQRKTTFPHELGHVLDYESANFYQEYIKKENHGISSNDNFLNIYSQISSPDSNASNYLRDYAFTSPTECFAECVSEYQNDPEPLKEIDIDIKGYDNLYEYMNDILN